MSTRLGSTFDQEETETDRSEL